MSQTAIKITLVCEPDIEKDVETALVNSGIQFTKEEISEPTEATCIYIPNNIPSLSVALHILETKGDVVDGNIELPDGREYELTQEGRNQLKQLLTEAMTRQGEVPTPTQFLWWTPFISEIKEHIFPKLGETIDKFNDLIEWYPRASGEGKKMVMRNFLLLLTGIMGVMFVLTWFDKISGDAFVFVMGALVGYIFAFLERFLGILTHE